MRSLKCLKDRWLKGRDDFLQLETGRICLKVFYHLVRITERKFGYHCSLYFFMHKSETFKFILSSNMTKQGKGCVRYVFFSLRSVLCDWSSKLCLTAQTCFMSVNICSTIQHLNNKKMVNQFFPDLKLKPVMQTERGSACPDRVTH